MRRGTAGLLAIAAMAVSAVAGDGDPADKAKSPHARDPELQTKIDRAIERGVEWLRSKQKKDGAFQWSLPFAGDNAGHRFGTTALGVQVLRSCGVPANDPAVKSGLARMRDLWLAGSAPQTYEVAIALLALEAHYAPAPGEPGGELEPGKPSPVPRNIPEKDRDWIRALSRRLIEAQSNGGGFGYGAGRAPVSWTDLSNTQYALLGLKAARRCGIEVERSVFLRAAQYVTRLQEPSGPKVERRSSVDVDEKGYAKRRSRAPIHDSARGFGYQEPKRCSGSMTAAGVSSLVICRGELRGSDKSSESRDAILVDAIRDGLAWLGRNFSVDGNPMAGGIGIPVWHYYYLYGLERAGVLSGVRWMGSHDWYVEGATYLVKAQDELGSWQSDGSRIGMRGNAGLPAGDLLDTCFALLFLKRATFRVEGAVATEEADDALDLTGAAELDDDSYRAVFDTVFSRYLRAKPDRRGTLVSDFLALGIRAIPLLIRLLEDAEVPRRAAAIEALHRLTGESQGFAADSPDEARAAAVAAWEEWWFARRGRLVADAGTGRFREGPK